MGMVRNLAAVLAAALLSTAAVAQEVLVPVGHAAHRVHAAKADVADTIELPFFDDFAGYSGAPDARLWADGGASVSDGYAPLPPTVGAMTLDAYDAAGSLYRQATTSLFGADTATSRALRLGALGPQDSVVLSFYYLPGGGSGNLWERVGDTPDPADSLMLEFYSESDSAWHTVWSRGGISVDTLVAQTGRSWQYVAVALADSCYFADGFRFRFRNLCSIEYDSKAGRTVGGDQWHIDYVSMDRARSVVDGGVVRDVAFVEPAPPMLKYYRDMPARQFMASEMADRMALTIANLYSSELASHYAYHVVDRSGDTVYSYDGGYRNAPHDGYQTDPTHASPTVGYVFDPAAAPYTVVHVVREGSAGDVHGGNDTVRMVQELDYRFAYDDGSAENGYGITSTASKLYLAYRFDLNVEDTLTAVDMFFNRTYESQNEEVQFYITIWQAGPDGRPQTVLYRDAATRMPQTGVYHRYVLDYGVVVPQGGLFVGFEQVGNTYINIGFDRSRNSSDRIWYLTSTEWQHSILSGSLMIRPCFGVRGAQVSIVSVPEASARLAVSPNPACSTVTLSGVDDASVSTVYDMRGMKVAEVRGRILDVSALPAGIYVVRSGASSAKLIIRR